jgi:antitoxin MazE
MGGAPAAQRVLRMILNLGENGVRIAKWGNSLAIRLGVALIKMLNLKKGDEIEIHAADARRLSIAHKAGNKELLKRLHRFRGRLPADFKFDRDEANSR